VFELLVVVRGEAYQKFRFDHRAYVERIASV